MNWKTTVAGVLAIVAATTNAASALLSGHPVDWVSTGAAIVTGIGLIAAADAKKGS